jgi:hypothetical protein
LKLAMNLDWLLPPLRFIGDNKDLGYPNQVVENACDMGIIPGLESYHRSPRKRDH